MKFKLVKSTFLLLFTLPIFNLSSCNKTRGIYSCLGDSITWGATPITGEQIKENYAYLTAKKLNYKNENVAIPGATIAKCDKTNYWIIDEINSVPAGTSIVSVMGGCNDYGYDVPLGNIDSLDLTTFYGSYNYISIVLKEKFPNAFVFYMTPCQRLYGDQLNKVGLKMDDYVQAVKNIGNRNNVPVLDMYTLDILNDLKSTGDACHPSASVHKKIIAPYVIKYLKEKLG